MFVQAKLVHRHACYSCFMEAVHDKGHPRNQQNCTHCGEFCEDLRCVMNNATEASLASS